MTDKPSVGAFKLDIDPIHIRIQEMKKAYDGVPVLRGVTLDVHRGVINVIIGGSGAGKSVFTRQLLRLEKPDSGKIVVDGTDIAMLDDWKLVPFRKKFGMVFQFGALFDSMSVFDNVAFPLREHTALGETLIRDLVLMKLQAVGLRGVRDLMPSQVSGGMSRRVALARAIALDPELIMYDEPFAGLDPISMGVAARLIRELNRALGVTSIVVSHDVHETFEIADRIVFIANGGIVAQGTPAEMRASDDPLVRQFIDAQADGPVRFHQPAQPLDEDFGLAARGDGR